MLIVAGVLFGFSIAVMTFAQKAALETGESTAAAIDERRADIRQQIASLDDLIMSYRLNAEKQSKSIYANSRELGQDSINKATELIAEKPDKKLISRPDNVSVLRPVAYEGLKADGDAGSAVNDIIAYADKVARLYESGKLKTLEKNAIRNALQKHHDIQIDSQKAGQVSDIVKDYVEAL